MERVSKRELEFKVSVTTMSSFYLILECFLVSALSVVFVGSIQTKTTPVGEKQLLAGSPVIFDFQVARCDNRSLSVILIVYNSVTFMYVYRYLNYLECVITMTFKNVILY